MTSWGLAICPEPTRTIPICNAEVLPWTRWFLPCIKLCFLHMPMRSVLFIVVVGPIWVNRWPRNNESESRYPRHLNQFIFPHWLALHESRRTRIASSVFTFVIRSVTRFRQAAPLPLRHLLQWRCPRRRRPTPPASTPVLPPALPPRSGQIFSYPLLRPPEPY
jgi:hypothetical protein